MGELQTELVMNILRWLQRYRIKFYPPQNLQPFPYARNFCVSRFLESDYEYLWFIDADTVPPHYALEFFLHDNKDMVVGVTNSMKRDTDGIIKPAPMVLKKVKGGYKVKEGRGLEKIDASGLSCALIHRRVFEAINYPWFEEKYIEGVTRDADFIFCEKVKRAGFKIWADYDVHNKHYKKVFI